LKQRELIVLFELYTSFSQTIHSADDTADMSFLTDTSHLDEKDDTKTKEALFQRQRMQLEEEHHKLVEYAAELAKQVLSSTRHAIKLWNHGSKLTTR
jgi:hypothetical protein